MTPTNPDSRPLPADQLKSLFAHSIGAHPQRLHFAAHSHHPWPDVTLEAQTRAWHDAARRLDHKWGAIFEEVVGDVQQRIAAILGLGDPRTLAFAPNTHEFVKRLIAGEDGGKKRILATDSEFHSFTRQVTRLVEAGWVDLDVVATRPFDTFAERFCQAAAAGSHDLVFLSHVFFDSGFVVPDLGAIVASVPNQSARIVIDGYHSFLARPFSLADVQHRAYYIAGGYKYAMAGEGACFLHCPPGDCGRPLDTGWFATFAELAAPRRAGEVPYGTDGSRFMGATFDPVGLYRLQAVLRTLEDIGWTVTDIHSYIEGLQQRFLDGLGQLDSAPLRLEQLEPELGHERGHFLTFRCDDAAALDDALRERQVIVDHRGNRLRIGFGLYQDESDVARLLECLATI